MHGRNVSNICSAVINFFNKTIDRTSKTVKFVKRKSKLSAKSFVEAMICNALSGEAISLERMCQSLKERNIKITKQGLHQRFNDESQQLLKILFEKALNDFRTERADLIDLLKPFSSIKITDSSTILLPPHLKPIYRGLGGSSSESSVKLQLTFDYLHGQINNAIIGEGRSSDFSYTDHLCDIKPATLYLQDLGYFKTKTFEKIHNSNAYFVSRHSYKAGIFDEENKKIDLFSLLKKSPDIFEKKVYLGEKERVPMRFIAFRLSDDVVEKRIKKIRRAIQKQGKTPSKEVLQFARWSMYITNTAEEILSTEQVHLVYTIRWQIELFFKLCKSEIGIDKVNGRSCNRIICEIYAKLICAIQFFYICFPLRWMINGEISFEKAYKIIKTRSHDFFVSLKSRYRLILFMKTFISDIKEFAMKDKYRRKRHSTYQKLINESPQGVAA